MRRAGTHNFAPLAQPAGAALEIRSELLDHGGKYGQSQLRREVSAVNFVKLSHSRGFCRLLPTFYWSPLVQSALSAETPTRGASESPLDLALLRSLSNLALVDSFKNNVFFFLLIITFSSS